MDEIENLLIVSDQESTKIIDTKTASYQAFKRDFIIFLKLLYDRLKKAEQEQLLDPSYELGNNILSFATDEFIYEFDQFAKILSEIDRARGIKSSPDDYKNKLVEFRGMYNKFFQCLNEPLGSLDALKLFEDLVKRCLTRLGFDQVNTHLYSGHIIFEIDICSRLVKLMDQFYLEQREFKDQHPELLSVYVNSIDTYINYLKPRLNNWDINPSDMKENTHSSTIVRK